LPARVDALVVGGGINGVGIARDLAGRGASVLLCEKDDLAAHTSSSSTKLIHGGLRYLEHYEFALVRKALAEREVLLRSAAHIIRPMRFVMPHDPGMRPVWMVRAGLFLYDHLARREWLRGSRAVDLREHIAGAAMKPQVKRAFVYSDAWVDDARLVVLNAIDAAERGAQVLTRWACVDARREAGEWRVRLQSEPGNSHTLVARALVNAAGPWAARFLAEQVHVAQPRSLRLVKGSHIVVRKLFDHDHAYLFQNADKRIIFAIPYEGDFTLIGTTDVEYDGAIGEAQVDAAEVTYLCEQASRYFLHPVRPADMVWSYCGVRPLLDDEAGDPSAVTRDYALELEHGEPGAAAPLLSVWGGKLTTYRKLAEEAADLLAGPLRLTRGAWTSDARLPGGEFVDAAADGPVRPDNAFARFGAGLDRRYPGLDQGLRRRLARAYGTRAQALLGDGSLGAEIGPGLHEAELNYLYANEWACTADDVLWRRTKLGLHFSAAERAAVAAWCETHWKPRPAAAASSRERAWN